MLFWQAHGKLSYGSSSRIACRVDCGRFTLDRLVADSLVIDSLVADYVLADSLVAPSVMASPRGVL